MDFKSLNLTGCFFIQVTGEYFVSFKGNLLEASLLSQKSSAIFTLLNCPNFLDKVETTYGFGGIALAVKKEFSKVVCCLVNPGEEWTTRGMNVNRRLTTRSSLSKHLDPWGVGLILR